MFEGERIPPELLADYVARLERRDELSRAIVEARAAMDRKIKAHEQAKADVDAVRVIIDALLLGES